MRTLCGVGGQSQRAAAVACPRTRLRRRRIHRDALRWCRGWRWGRGALLSPGHRVPVDADEKVLGPVLGMIPWQCECAQCC